MTVCDHYTIDNILPIHLVTSDEFTQLSHALTHSSVIGLDAEWNPNRNASTFPIGSLLQMHIPVFLIDFQAINLFPLYGLLANELNPKRRISMQLKETMRRSWRGSLLRKHEKRLSI